MSRLGKKTAIELISCIVVSRFCGLLFFKNAGEMNEKKRQNKIYYSLKLIFDKFIFIVISTHKYALAECYSCSQLNRHITQRSTSYPTSSKEKHDFLCLFF